MSRGKVLKHRAVAVTPTSIKLAESAEGDVRKMLGLAKESNFPAVQKTMANKYRDVCLMGGCEWDDVMMLLYPGCCCTVVVRYRTGCGVDGMNFASQCNQRPRPSPGPHVVVQGSPRQAGLQMDRC